MSEQIQSNGVLFNSSMRCLGHDNDYLQGTGNYFVEQLRKRVLQ